MASHIMQAWQQRISEPTPDPVALSDYDMAALLKLIKQGRANEFYWTRKWKRERVFVAHQDNNECQICKARGRYRKVAAIHHVNHLAKHPALALTMWVKDGSIWERQLVGLCDSCHDEQHPERLRQYKKKKVPLTVERWD